MSKANQAFKQNDEAVSPVIGVILMVAITVVLAAVVFVLVSNLGADSETAPAISWNKDEATDRLTVVTASSNADWQRLEIDGNVDFQVNVAGENVTVVAGSPTSMSTDADPIRAGDRLQFCISSATAIAPVSLTITITDPSANQVVKTESFTVSTAAC